MLEIIQAALDNVSATINEPLSELSPLQIITLTLASAYALKQLSQLPSLYRQRHAIDARTTLISSAYGLFRHIPGLNNLLEKEVGKEVGTTLGDIKEDVREDRKNIPMLKTLPQTGSDNEAILKLFKTLHEKHNQQYSSGAEYIKPDQELMDLLTTVYTMTAFTNPIHENWPLLKAIKAQVISWGQHLFGSETGNPGIITHGGTSSIIEAMNMYVLAARAKGIDVPEIVVPSTAHAAFLKAVRMLHAKLIVVPVNKESGAVKATDMRRYISHQTAVIVGSAPSFMYGVADPIEDLGQLALEKKVPLHVDACLGGFVTAFAPNKDTTPNYDFRVPGVQSISADTHKYGFAPKGSSMLLYRGGKDFSTASIDLQWSGGMYVTDKYMDGSESGVPVASIFATMLHFGQDGYEKSAKDILDLAKAIREEASTIPGLNVVPSSLMVFGAKSDDFDVHVVCDKMKEKGFALSRLQNPDGFHLCVTKAHTDVPTFKDEFITALRASIEWVIEHPTVKPKGEAKAYGKLNTGIGVPYQVQKRIGQGYLDILLSEGFDDIRDDELMQHSIAEIIGGCDKEAVLDPVQQPTLVIKDEPAEASREEETFGLN